MTISAELRMLMEDIAESAAKKAVGETLVMLGFNHQNPLEAQREMVALREVTKVFASEEFRLDLEHLRFWRKTYDEVKSKGIIASVLFILTAIAGVTWVGFRHKLGF